MPIIKSALKKMRQDKKRTLVNKSRKAKVKKLIDKAVKNPVKENVRIAISVVDKLAKAKVIHSNKAGRIKSRLTKLLNKTSKEEPKKIKSKK